MASFTLDSIRQAVEDKFAPTVIELTASSKVTLKNPARMESSERKQLNDLLKQLDGLDLSGDGDLSEDEALEKLADVAKQIFSTASTPAQATKLINAIGSDWLVLMEIISKWVQESGLGEVTSSTES